MIEYNSIFDIPVNATVAIVGYGEYGRRLHYILTTFRKDIKIDFIVDDHYAGISEHGKVIKSTDEFKSVENKNFIVLIGALGDEIVDKIVQSLSAAIENLYIVSDISKFEHNCMLVNECEMWPGFYEEQSFADNELLQLEQKIHAASLIFSDDDREKYLTLIESRLNSNIKTGKYLLDKTGLISNAKQYYEHYDFNSIRVVIEGGLFDGYDAFRMIKTFKNLQMIYSFEPFLDSYHKFWGRKTIESSGKHTIINSVLWENNCELKFINGGAWSHQSNSSDAQTVRAVSIDEFKIEQGVGKIDFIKLDVEGSEKKVLLGAKETIATDRPILAVSIYHSKYDMIELPLLLKDICEDYIFKIEHYTYHFTETVVYAIPMELDIDMSDTIAN